jgi:hypothetical protein
MASAGQSAYVVANTHPGVTQDLTLSKRPKRNTNGVLFLAVIRRLFSAPVQQVAIKHCSLQHRPEISLRMLLLSKNRCLTIGRRQTASATPVRALHSGTHLAAAQLTRCCGIRGRRNARIRAQGDEQQPVANPLEAPSADVAPGAAATAAAAAVAPLQAVPWKWTESDDALWAYGALFAVLGVGTLPALHTSPLAGEQAGHMSCTNLWPPSFARTASRGHVHTPARPHRHRCRC